MVIIYVAGLLVIFYLLAIVCDRYFVRSLDVIAGKLKLSEDVAGATLMAIGSSAPEFFTALFAITKVGSEQVGAGTIVGSAIFNILVIVGASAAVSTTFLKWKPVIRDMLFYTLAIIILLLTFSDGVITLWETVLYIGGYIAYIFLLSKWSSWFGNGETKDKLKEVPKEVAKQEAHIEKKTGFGYAILAQIDRAIDATFPNLDKNPKQYVYVFVISLVYIGVLSWALVELAILSAHELGIPEVIIALTVLAAGTSIPDLLSSLIVAKQGRGDMAVSNAVGSNVFDIFIGLGLPWFLYIVFTGKQMMVSTENLISSILLLFFTVISLMTLLISQRFKIGPKMGYLLLSLYAAYLVYSIVNAYAPGIL